MVSVNVLAFPEDGIIAFSIGYFAFNDVRKRCRGMISALLDGDIINENEPKS